MRITRDHDVILFPLPRILLRILAWDRLRLYEILSDACNRCNDPFAYVAVDLRRAGVNMNACAVKIFSELFTRVSLTACWTETMRF